MSSLLASSPDPQTLLTKLAAEAIEIHRRHGLPASYCDHARAHYLSAGALARLSPSFEQEVKKLDSYKRAQAWHASDEILARLSDSLRPKTPAEVDAPVTIASSASLWQWSPGMTIEELATCFGYDASDPASHFDSILARGILKDRIGRPALFGPILDNSLMSFLAFAVGVGTSDHVERAREYLSSIGSPVASYEAFALLEQFSITNIHNEDETATGGYRLRGARDVEASPSRFEVGRGVVLETISCDELRYLREIPEFGACIPQERGQFVMAPWIGFIARCPVKLEKRLYHSGLLEPTPMLLDLRRALRLLKPVASGDPSFSALLHVCTAPSMLADSHLVVAEDVRKITYGPIYTLSEHSLKDLEALFSRLERLKGWPAGFLGAALHWFEVGRCCARLEERIVFHFVALEGLFVRPKERDTGAVVSRRASHLAALGDLSQQQRLQAALRGAYELRNDVVHRGGVSADRLAELAVACGVVDDTLRLVLQNFLYFAELGWSQELHDALLSALDAYDSGGGGSLSREMCQRIEHAVEQRTRGREKGQRVRGCRTDRNMAGSE